MRIFKKTLIAMVLVYVHFYSKAVTVIVLQFLAANALELRDPMLSVANTGCEWERKYHSQFFPIATTFATNDSIIPSSCPLSHISLYAHLHSFPCPQLPVPRKCWRIVHLHNLGRQETVTTQRVICLLCVMISH